MSKFWHIAFQVLMVAGQGAVVASKLIPPPYNIIVPVGMSAVQGIVAIVNHAKGK